MARRDRRRSEERTSGGSTVGNVISTLIIVIALAVFCYAGYRLIRIYFDYKAGTDEYSALESLADGTRESEGFDEDTMVDNETMGEDQWGDTLIADRSQELEEMENPIDFDGLKAINEDVIAWLEMEAIDINYPVVQGENNDYYLHRTFRGQDNFSGSIFMEYINNPQFMNRNTILYGHNMKNGSMFGSLKEYREQEVYDRSPYFWIYTPDKIYKYEIFSCAEVGTYSENYQITFQDSIDFQAYLDMAKAQSVIKTDVEVGMGDTVVTLSTCTGNDATRFIVQGKRVRTYKAVPKAGGYETHAE